MTKDEALELLVAEKSTPALSRAFIAWLYKNGYMIVKKELETKDNWANWGIVLPERKDGEFL